MCIRDSIYSVGWPPFPFHLRTLLCTFCIVVHFLRQFMYIGQKQWERGKNKDSIFLQSIPKEVKIIPKICQGVLNHECYLAHECETRKLLDQTQIKSKSQCF